LLASETLLYRAFQADQLCAVRCPAFWLILADWAADALQPIGAVYVQWYGNQVGGEPSGSPD
jgi:hypothetical protein